MKNGNYSPPSITGVVVVIALLAGIGLTSAADDTQIGSGYAWFNNSDGYRTNTLRVNDTAVNDNSAVEVDFTRTGGYTTFAYGVNVTGAQTDRGANTGIRGQTSLNTAGQEGLAVGSLAGSCGWHSHGHFYGVHGRSTPNSLSNVDSSFTSTGLGGKFYAGPDDTHTLTLNSLGTYWVGGVYGKVEGNINGPAPTTAGAVAGVIGIDNTTGTAPSYAGYFDGSVRVTDLPLGSATDGIVVADPDGVLRNSGKNMSALGADADWYNVSDPGNPPDDITNNIYTQGKVGIGTSAPTHMLHINGTTYFDDVAYIGTGQRIQAEAPGGARILGEQGHTPAKPAIGFFSTNGVDDGDGYGNGIYRPLAHTMAFATLSQERMRIAAGGNIGIGTTNPQRALHVNDVIRLEPRLTAPLSPAEGDIYVNSNDHHIYCRLGGIWKQLD